MKAQNQTKVFNRMATTVWGNEGFERPNRNWQKTTSKCFDKNSKFFLEKQPYFTIRYISGGINV